MDDDHKPFHELAVSFDAARDQAAHDKHQQSEFDLRQTEIKIGEGKLAPENTAKFTNKARLGKGVETEEKRKERRRHEAHMIMVALEQMREQLALLEADLIEKYGEHFAENLAAELLDEDTYAEIMMIQDQEERRHRIALEINKGLADGSIDPDVVKQNPDFKKWLDLSESMEQQRALNASQTISSDERLHSEADKELVPGDKPEQEEEASAHSLTINSTESKAFDGLLPT